MLTNQRINLDILDLLILFTVVFLFFCNNSVLFYYAIIIKKPCFLALIKKVFVKFSLSSLETGCIEASFIERERQRDRNSTNGKRWKEKGYLHQSCPRRQCCI